MTEVTKILNELAAGESRGSGEILPLVYDELRKLAAEKLRHEKPGQTLDATALVHEAYVRLVDVRTAQRWDCRGHFYAAAAEAMRRILVDRARAKAAVKRGGGGQRLNLDDVEPASADRPDDLLALDEALDRLEAHDATAARLVKLRFFAGLTHQQAAEALGIGRRAADRLWALARTWLYQQLCEP